MNKDYPQYIREEAARLCNEEFALTNNEGVGKPYTAANITQMASERVLCELLTNGCKPVVDPDLQLAREIRAELYTTQDFKDRSIYGDFDNSDETQRVLALIKRGGIAREKK